MIQVIGFLKNKFVCGLIQDICENRNLLKNALACGLTGTIMRV